MSFKFIPEQRLASNARWLVCLVALMLLMACKSEEQERQEKYRATVNPENGKLVTVNGEKFRIVYIGGVRFRFPDTPDRRFGWMGNHATGPTTDGMNIHLYWPDIPPGKAPGTKFKALKGQVGKTNNVFVLVTGTEKPIDINQYKDRKLRIIGSEQDYIVRDDLKLGLRLYYPKRFPNTFYCATSLTDDALEPWGRQPVILLGSHIYFSYDRNIEVILEMQGWGAEVNRNWKEIYLAVIETLNKYRQDQQ